MEQQRQKNGDIDRSRGQIIGADVRRACRRFLSSVTLPKNTVGIRFTDGGTDDIEKTSRCELRNMHRNDETKCISQRTL